MKQTALSVVLAAPHDLQAISIPVPQVPGESVRVEMRACGICGSDLRYLQGENPWSLHTLGTHVVSPPNMVLGHEVSGVIKRGEVEQRVAILAYKACGKCRPCLAGRENLCADVQHIGHATGWPRMPYYPGGMAESFEVWEGFAKPIPDSISFEAATFLDGLAVAIHACDRAHVDRGSRVAVVGLGPIGMMAAQVARIRGAETVVACDTTSLPVELAGHVGLSGAVQANALDFLATQNAYDSIIDTVGANSTITAALRALAPGGALALLAVHEGASAVDMVALSAERVVTSSANNRYRDFDLAIELLSSGHVAVEPLITHRFPLSKAIEAFATMAEKDARRAYKIILKP